MKRRFVLSAFVLMLAVINVFATKKDSKVRQYELSNGIPVYIKDAGNGDFCSIYIIVKGGVTYLTPENSGLEDAVFSMLSKGSASYTRDELKKYFFETHGEFRSYVSFAGSAFGMNCLSHYFDDTFARFAEAFMAPAFSQKEYELLMNDYRQDVQETLNDPQSMLFYYAGMMLYQDHPYAAKVSVTPDSMKNITYDAVVSFYKTLLDSRRISIVAAGCYDSEKLLGLLNGAFSGIKAGTSPLHTEKIPEISVEGSPVVLVHQNAAGAAEVMRAFASPSAKSPDYLTACITAAIFTDIMHNIVREKNGICYTPVSQVLNSDAPFGVEMLVRTTDLKKFSSALEECRSILRSGKTISSINEDGTYVLEPLEKRLEGYVNRYITSRYYSQATVNGTALRMSASLLQFGDVSFADKRVETVKKITVTDIERVFDTYWVKPKGRWFAVVGPMEEEKISF